MSDEREQAGAPVEQTEVTDTQVLAAVERAAEVPATENAIGKDGSDVSETIESAPQAVPVVREPAIEVPSAVTPASVAQAAPLDSSPEGSSTEVPPVIPPALPPVRDGEIRISADHPMAALYMQSPTPPEMKGNRGAGVLIALLSTVAFALFYAGALALWLAPNFPPSTFLSKGLLPWVLNWGFAAAVVGFFIGLALLVLIAGRAGWWAYVLGGLLVAALTWVVTLLGYALDARFAGESVTLHPYSLVVDFGLFFPVLAAALVAREVSIWFGAWIGARGRKVKRQNAEALVEYENALSEAQAKLP